MKVIQKDSILNLVTSDLVARWYRGGLCEPSGLEFDLDYKKLLLFFGSKCLYISVVGESDLASLKLIGAEELPIVNGDEPLHFEELSKERRGQNRSWKST